MDSSSPPVDSSIDELEKLLKPGLLGFYSHFETTQVFAISRRGEQPLNVFTIVVAEERLGPEPLDPQNLNPLRIELRSLKGWVFGIRRSVQLIGDLLPALRGLEAGHGLQIAADILMHTHLTEISYSELDFAIVGYAVECIGDP